MPSKPRRAGVIGAVVVALVLVAGLVVVGRIVWDRLHRTPLEQAMGLVPAQTKRLSFTDWSAVRQRVGVPTTEAPGRRDVGRLIGRAYNLDLSSVSSLSNSAEALQGHYGFSPATITWEAYAQWTRGEAMVTQLGSGAAVNALAGRLAGLGYHRPASATGVWLGGANLVSSISTSLTPEVQYVVLLPDQGLVVTSDTAANAALEASVAQGHAPSLAGSAQQLAAQAGLPAAAMLWAGDFACTDLAMSHADQSSQAQANLLIARAGTVTPLTGLVMGLDPDRTFVVGMAFASPAEARENLRPRARLAVGPAVGRGGDFAQFLRLRTATAVGATVELTFDPREKSGYVLSRVYSGPVVFATC